MSGGLPLGLGLVQQVRDSATRSALSAFRPTVPQLAVLSDDSPHVVWRDGNQLGKTTGMLVDLIHRCRGTHPWQKVREPPINALIVGFSIEQMGQAGSVMEKCWELLPKDEISPDNSFRKGFGITGKPPRIVFNNGSVIQFGTFRQSPTSRAGATLHHIYSDEPCPSDIMAELFPRLLREKGTFRGTFTPVPNMPDQSWLRKLIEKGRMVEHNYGLKAEHCIPEGSPFPYISQASIDELEAALPPFMRGMRIRGDFDPIMEDRWVAAFTKQTHVVPCEPPPGATLAVGIDHGIVMGKQAAVLIAVEAQDTLNPRVYYLNETVGTEATTQEVDAAAILTMLREVGLEWHHVDHWIGDRTAGDHRHHVRKTNTMLRRHLAHQVGIGPQAFPRIRVPKKFRGSVVAGLTLINAIAASRRGDGNPGLLVSPRCSHLADALFRFAGDVKDPCKDVLDAARYATEYCVAERNVLGVISRHFGYG